MSTQHWKEYCCHHAIEIHPTYLFLHCFDNYESPKNLGLMLKHTYGFKEKFWLTYFCGQKNVWMHKNFGVQKFFLSQKEWFNKNLSANKIWVQKSFRSKIIFDQK